MSGTVAILGDYRGVLVVSVPGRKSPAIAVQGDTLKILLDLVEEVSEESESSAENASLRRIHSMLQDRLDAYEHVLRDRGLPLPY